MTLVVALILAGVPVHPIDKGLVRAAQVCSVGDRTHPRPMWFAARGDVNALGCPLAITVPRSERNR
jgi:hypothetical protein